MDQSFNRATLARCLISKDFYADKYLSDEKYRQAIVAQAVEVAQASEEFSPILLVKNHSQKRIYSVENLPEKLILRKCARNIRIQANIRVKPRTQIIREIKAFLKEGTAYRIYRLDIKSFFETCDFKQILVNFQKYRISNQTQILMSMFLSEFNKNHSYGIPRGVETSPILSELYLADMDRRILALDQVFYYSRFVDDMFIVSSGDENKRDFLNTIKSFLPVGLSMNHNKMQICDVPKRSTGMTPVSNPEIVKIDYLGYEISVVDHDLSKINPTKPASLKSIEYRNVLIDLTKNKVNRLKEKIFKSFYAFSNDSDFQLLKDRLVFLSSNRDLLNKVNDRKIPTGLYYSNSEIDNPSRSLDNIDKFLKLLVNKPQGRIGKVLLGKLTKSQKNELLKISFSVGFSKRIFTRYSPNRLFRIARIW